MPDVPVTKRGRSVSDASGSSRRSAQSAVADARSLFANGSVSVGTLGEGSLTFDQLSVAERGRTTLVQAPELLVAEPSPELRPVQTDESSGLLTPVPGRPGEPTGEMLASSSASSNGHANGNGRPRSATTSDSSSYVTFTQPPPLPTPALPSSPPTSLGTVSSRPSSRSASVNSQDASGSYLAPKPPNVRSPSSSRNNKKRSTSGGIAGALALSGVALASPSAQLRHPVAIAALGRSGTSPPTSRESLDTESDGGLSVAGTENGGALQIDLLGDFDDVVSQLGTGYAVASSKRNADFHAIFKNIPDDDYLIEGAHRAGRARTPLTCRCPDYGCALQREILIQGRLYISEHHLSFNANIFGWVTTVRAPSRARKRHRAPRSLRVVAAHAPLRRDCLDREAHDGVRDSQRDPSHDAARSRQSLSLIAFAPRAPLTMDRAQYTFASFLSRDTTHDLICNIWRMVHPVVPPSASLPDNVPDSDDDGASIESNDDGRPTRRRLRGLSGGRRRAETGTSATGPPVPGDKLVRPSPGSPRASRQDLKVHPQTVDTLPTLKGLKEVCMDTTFPSAPEKIYNLMFTSGFMKDFWTNNQKLLGAALLPRVCDTRRSAADQMLPAVGRTANFGLGAREVGLEPACAHDELHQAFERLDRAEADQVPAHGRECACRL